MTPEQAVQDRIRFILAGAGWLSEKTHGNQFQPGWPDLWLFHPEHPGVSWLEVKAPGGYYTPAQLSRFPKWESRGVGIWTCDDPDRILKILSGPPNWRDFLSEADRAALEMFS